MRKLHKKGFQLTEIPSLAVILLVIAILLGIGATILDSVRSSQCSFSYDPTTGQCLNSTGGTGGDTGTTPSFNITSQGMEAQDELSEWQGTWVVIVAAAVVLGIVGRYLFFKA